MAVGGQDVGFDDNLVYAGDTLRMTFTVTTGGTAAGVTAVAYRLADDSPANDGALQFTKTLGAGITVADGTASGTVDVAVVLEPSDTAGLSGDYHHELDLTASGDQNVVSRGRLRLQEAIS